MPRTVDIDEAAIDGRWAFERYEYVRHRLPSARFPFAPQSRTDLGELIEEFDAFVFDSFGVLNVGDTPIPGARARVDGLREAGKQVAILTNGATAPLASLTAKYRSLGFEFALPEIISSREVLANVLSASEADETWGVVAPAKADLSEFRFDAQRIAEDTDDLDHLDGFILLSSQTMSASIQNRLADALEKRGRPLLIGNPDLVAPREVGFSLEPGHFAHDLADRLNLTPEFFGKPFANAFEEVRRRLPAGIRPDRIAMIGDTLHTDILGGAGMGFRTILVTDHGVMKGMDVQACIETSGIVPDYIIPTI